MKHINRIEFHSLSTMD